MRPLVSEEVSSAARYLLTLTGQHDNDGIGSQQDDPDKFEHSRAVIAARKPRLRHHRPLFGQARL